MRTRRCMFSAHPRETFCAGFFNSSSPPPECSRRSGEQQHAGTYSLMVAGFSNAAYAYCYYKVFDDNIANEKARAARDYVYDIR